MLRLSRMLELRRALAVVTAGLLVAALSVPVWKITLSAPQYVDPLTVELYAYPRLAGDFEEVSALNKYVGFYYPDPVYVEPNYEVHDAAVDVPEWVLAPVAFVGGAVAAAVVAVLPSDRISRGLTVLFVSTVAVFGTMLAGVQYRLHQAGHALDPDAPLEGIDGFTPPVLGSYEVANISGSAGFGPGGYVAVGALALLAVAFSLRDSTATVADVPTLLRAGRRRLRDRISRRGAGDRDGSAANGDGSAATRIGDAPPDGEPP
ncbi:hypothetical protein [Halegenticoccus tardaugens]|uniref:hypothetical protein n=1 Tax=Halegenticoccus tardaugens TaxID=2071624 RepID=UPI001E626445|nr:hypothetical protein [Halegenticoccus tardaugens]